MSVNLLTFYLAVADPKFIPLAGPHRANDDFQEAALGVRARRQALLAANIANVDTPNYKAVDLDFQASLRAAQAKAEHKAVALNLTAAAHIGAQATATSAPADILYRVPLQAAADGNTVEMDVERAQFAENAMYYEASVQFIGQDFKDMLQMLSSLK